MFKEIDHRRKCSPQSRVWMALNRLDALKDDLDGIEKRNEAQVQPFVSDHVLALEGILEGNIDLTFSEVSEQDLKAAGVIWKPLTINYAKLSELTEALKTNAEAETIVLDLYSRVKKIYAHINIAYERAFRMIIDAVLFALVEIMSTTERSVAIYPDMKIDPGAGVHIVDPVSEYKLWLSGSIDYAIFEYENTEDNRATMLYPGVGNFHTVNTATRQMYVCEAKHQKEDGVGSYSPEAVSQAIAALKNAGLSEVRFCLSDGEKWKFYILKEQNETLTYYEPLMGIALSRESIERSDKELRVILLLLCEWLKPTVTDLYSAE
ncbi:hypothetical protein D9615_007114 [Tricholomella constricta]|uniref:Uncharacterized protein n=1 Tax=Tricholomella constricta TaxID=117010 RepID=A0A8H5H850_9AGAR|nr:hypothetical protein D9615_007114 [Tricholomella constricta]